VTVQGTGGTATAALTITAGEPALATSVSPPSAAPGEVVTVKGTGLTGVTTVVVGSNSPGNPAQSAPVTNNTGTEMTFTMPTGLVAGASHIDINKPDCSFMQINVDVL